MTLDEYLNWKGPDGRKARIKLGAGVDSVTADKLARVFSVIHDAAPGEVDHYTDPSGFRIGMSGQDADGMPLLSIDKSDPVASRVSGYDALEKSLEALRLHGASRPEANLAELEQTPHSPNADIRARLLSSMRSAPSPDRAGAARRGLESGLLASTIATLAGGDGLAVGSAFRGAAGGAQKAFAGRFQDAQRNWQNGVRSDAQAVALDDSEVKATNAGQHERFAQDKADASQRLAEWRASGDNFHRSLQGAIAEVAAQQRDVKDGNDVSAEAAKRQDAKGKAVLDANKTTKALLVGLIRDKRVDAKVFPELARRIGMIDDATEKGVAAPEWVYGFDKGTMAAMTPAEKETIRLRDETLKQGGVRLQLQNDNLSVTRQNLGERVRHNKKMESRPVGGSRALVDPVAGAKGTVSEKYGYHVANHDQLLEQKSQLAPRIAELEALRKTRRLTDTELQERQDLGRQSDTLTRYLQSVTNALASLEGQYPALRRNYQRLNGSKNRQGEYKGSTMDKSSGLQIQVPGMGKVKVEKG